MSFVFFVMVFVFIVMVFVFFVVSFQYTRRMRKPLLAVDALERSIAWYKKYFR